MSVLVDIPQSQSCREHNHDEQSKTFKKELPAPFLPCQRSACSNSFGRSTACSSPMIVLVNELVTFSQPN